MKSKEEIREYYPDPPAQEEEAEYSLEDILKEFGGEEASSASDPADADSQTQNRGWRRRDPAFPSQGGGFTPAAYSAKGTCPAAAGGGVVGFCRAGEADTSGG